MLSDTEFNRITGTLNPIVKRQVNQAMLRFLRTYPRGGTAERILEAAMATLQPIFPGASSRERTTLAFYMIGKLLGRHDHSLNPYARGDEALTSRTKWKSKHELQLDAVDWETKDALSEMGEQDILVMQMLMDRKAQLERLISDVMKKGYEGGQHAVQALKSS